MKNKAIINNTRFFEDIENLPKVASSKTYYAINSVMVKPIGKLVKELLKRNNQEITGQNMAQGL